MGVSQKFWAGRSVLLTGHTGFKGSWAAFWLSQMGANVTGYALAPSSVQALYRELDIGEIISVDHRADINDSVALDKVIFDVKPEVVIHMAAQAIVRESYLNPLETYITNVIGTVRLLEAVRRSTSVKSVVVVTSDKCYENVEWMWGYRENDRLGGKDPYSASKACAELISNVYMQSFFEEKEPHIATTRAGNVIGGGDWALDRIVPDCVKAWSKEKSVLIRNPNATRPWQHVLEPLSGYLLLGQRMLEGNLKIADAWNFGPSSDLNLSTERLVKLMHDQWPKIKGESAQQESAPHEAGFLILDSTKAKRSLGWSPVWGIDATIKHTINWYRAFEKDGIVITDQQIDLYSQDAISKNIIWS